MTINTLSVTNDMLGLLGELPINDLEQNHPVVPRALEHIRYENAVLQAEKWWFNCENTRVYPQPNGQILLPNDTLSADNFTRYPNLAVRGNRLYNLDKGTDRFDEPVDLRIHRLVPFDEAPVTARAHVAARAKLAFQASIDGDPEKTRLLSREFQESLMRLNAEHTRNTKANMFNRPYVQVVRNHIMGTRRHRGYYG